MEVKKNKTLILGNVKNKIGLQEILSNAQINENKGIKKLKDLLVL